MTCGIYSLRSPSGKQYIGSSKDIEYRVGVHKRRSLRGTNKSRMLNFAFQKYGDLEVKIILVCLQEDLLFYEQLCIDALKPEYNSSRIAGKVEFTDAVRHRMVQSRLGKSRSELAKVRTSESLKGVPWSPKRRAAYEGNGISEETRLKISKGLSGVQRSEETRSKMSDARRARKRKTSDDQDPSKN